MQLIKKWKAYLDGFGHLVVVHVCSYGIQLFLERKEIKYEETKGKRLKIHTIVFYINTLSQTLCLASVF